jgi:hypothetical protein
MLISGLSVGLWFSGNPCQINFRNLLKNGYIDFDQLNQWFGLGLRGVFGADDRREIDKFLKHAVYCGGESTKRPRHLPPESTPEK